MADPRCVQPDANEGDTAMPTTPAPFRQVFAGILSAVLLPGLVLPAVAGIAPADRAGAARPAAPEPARNGSDSPWPGAATRADDAADGITLRLAAGTRQGCPAPLPPRQNTRGGCKAPE